MEQLKHRLEITGRRFPRYPFARSPNRRAQRRERPREQSVQRDDVDALIAAASHQRGCPAEQRNLGAINREESTRTLGLEPHDVFRDLGLTEDQPGTVLVGNDRCIERGNTPLVHDSSSIWSSHQLSDRRDRSIAR